MAWNLLVDNSCISVKVRLALQTTTLPRSTPHYSNAQRQSKEQVWQISSSAC